MQVLVFTERNGILNKLIYVYRERSVKMIRFIIKRRLNNRRLLTNMFSVIAVHFYSSHPWDSLIRVNASVIQIGS